MFDLFLGKSSVNNQLCVSACLYVLNTDEDEKKTKQFECKFFIFTSFKF